MTNQAIILVHTCSFIPKYLLRTLECARVFNPKVAIYLITDLPASAFERFEITTVPLTELETDENMEFLASYKHHSVNKVKHEKFCFSRWFYINACIHKYNIDQCVHLDSDCMLFTGIKPFLEYFNSNNIAVSKWGSPHCSFITGHLDRFTKLILESFKDPAFFEWVTKENVILSDMILLSKFVEEHNGGVIYSGTELGGFIDTNINISEGFQMRYKRKRVYWGMQDDGLRLPYLKSIKDSTLQRAFALHYQGGPSKRWSSRFNRYPKTRLPLFLHKVLSIPVTAFYNLFQSHRLNPYPKV